MRRSKDILRVSWFAHRRRGRDTHQDRRIGSVPDDDRPSADPTFVPDFNWTQYNSVCAYFDIIANQQIAETRRSTVSQAIASSQRQVIAASRTPGHHYPERGMQDEKTLSNICRVMDIVVLANHFHKKEQGEQHDADNRIERAEQQIEASVKAVR
jgi:hypothetical protein